MFKYSFIIVVLTCRRKYFALSSLEFSAISKESLQGDRKGLPANFPKIPLTILSHISILTRNRLRGSKNGVVMVTEAVT